MNTSINTLQGNIAVWDSQGEGQPVLFIHGNSACKEIFKHQLESSLARKYRFLAVDLPGHGKSDNAKDQEDTYSFEGYAKVISEVIANLNLKNVVVVGASLGGHIGIELQRTKKLAGLVISGTPPIKIFEAGFPLPLFASLLSKIELSRSEAVEFAVTQGIDHEQHPFIVDTTLRTDGYARHFLIKSIQAGIGGDQRAVVETDDTPLCIIQGEDDKGINNAYITSIRYKNLFRNMVHIIPDAGHSVFWNQPEKFTSILASFLESLAHDKTSL
jgi:pimeloyl-ACP methyl ester carboxylesterase